MPVVQETEFQDNVVDAVVLVLLSIAGPDQKTNLKAASGGSSTPVRALTLSRENIMVVYTVSLNPALIPSRTWQVQ